MLLTRRKINCTREEKREKEDEICLYIVCRLCYCGCTLMLLLLLLLLLLLMMKTNNYDDQDNDVTEVFEFFSLGLIFLIFFSLPFTFSSLTFPSLVLPLFLPLFRLPPCTFISSYILFLISNFLYISLLFFPSLMPVNPLSTLSSLLPSINLSSLSSPLQTPLFLPPHIIIFCLLFPFSLPFTFYSSIPSTLLPLHVQSHSNTILLLPLTAFPFPSQSPSPPTHTRAHTHTSTQGFLSFNLTFFISEIFIIFFGSLPVLNS